jgi:hypothetical protein
MTCPQFLQPWLDNDSGHVANGQVRTPLACLHNWTSIIRIAGWPNRLAIEQRRVRPQCGTCKVHVVQEAPLDQMGMERLAKLPQGKSEIAPARMSAS